MYNEKIRVCIIFEVPMTYGSSQKNAEVVHTISTATQICCKRWYLGALWSRLLKQFANRHSTIFKNNYTFFTLEFRLGGNIVGVKMNYGIPVAPESHPVQLLTSYRLDPRWRLPPTHRHPYRNPAPAAWSYWAHKEHISRRSLQK